MDRQPRCACLQRVRAGKRGTLVFGDVIVPIDGSEASSHALDVGAVIARANHSKLHVMAYTTESHDPASFLPAIEYVAEVGDRHGLRPYLTVEALSSTVARQILQTVEERPGSLVCLSSHGRTRTAAYFGSVTAELLQQQTAPILVCGPKYEPGHFHFEMSGPLVVAVDGTEHSETILPIAESWSVVFGLPLEVVTVLPPTRSPGPVATYKNDDVSDVGYVRSVARGVGEVTAKAAGFEVLHDEKPARAIVDEAIERNATAIAMATHATGTHLRFSSPSVTAEVIKRSPIPVLTARPLKV